MARVSEFYDNLAESFHWIFADWQRSVAWQAGVLGPLVERLSPAGRLKILDCTCGIGTQALGLAARGHEVWASDISPASVARAEREARGRSLTLRFAVANITDLSPIDASGFDTIVSFDNSLPHLLTDAELHQAAVQVHSKLKRGGVFIASLRDYDRTVKDRPASEPPRFFSDVGLRRIVHQVWDWIDDRHYVLHLYITRETADGWASQHFNTVYRALLRPELRRCLEEAGFVDIHWLEPQQSGFYQPIVTARKP